MLDSRLRGNDNITGLMQFFKGLCLNTTFSKKNHDQKNALLSDPPSAVNLSLSSAGDIVAKVVIPAKAGIQDLLILLDSGSGPERVT